MGSIIGHKIDYNDASDSYSEKIDQVPPPRGSLMSVSRHSRCFSMYHESIPRDKEKNRLLRLHISGCTAKSLHSRICRCMRHLNSLTTCYQRNISFVQLLKFGLECHMFPPVFFFLNKSIRIYRIYYRTGP